jgi:hypothetical protein
VVTILPDHDHRLISTETFVPAMEAFFKYLDNLTDPSHLSAEAMLPLMDAFRAPFENHFRSEVDAIAALAAHPKSPKEGSEAHVAAKAKFDKWGENAIIHGGVTDVVMFFLFNLDREFEDGLWRDWPEVPGPVRWVGSRVVSRWHGGWWKFASCDADGRLRSLYALSS